MKLNSIAPLLFLGAAGTLVFIASEAQARYEEPEYTTISKSGDKEVRHYPALVAASVTLQGTPERSADAAFRILAGYIFGKNKAKGKIAMTVPVTEQMIRQKIAMTVPVTAATAGDSMTMRFFMPSRYSVGDLPEPLDSRITFSEIPAKKYAVVRFSGTGSQTNMKKHENALLEWLRDCNLSAIGEPTHAFYNPPWTPSFLRRNEVWVEIQ